MSDALLSERQDRVLTLTINRPQALNALDRSTVRALRKAFEEAAADSTLRCLVLTGSGRAFCAGADISELDQRHRAGDPDLGNDLRQNYSPLVRAIRACPHPVIAAINGTAAGAGLSLALACDLRLASRDATLIAVFVRVGLVPDAGSLFFLSRLVGYGRALEMALTGDPVSAEEAHRLGLVSAVVEPEELRPAAIDRARRLASGPAQAHRLIKRGMERALALDLEQTLELEAELQTLAARSADHREAVRAFLEKRRPVFGGRA